MDDGNNNNNDDNFSKFSKIVQSFKENFRRFAAILPISEKVFQKVFQQMYFILPVRHKTGSIFPAKCPI